MHWTAVFKGNYLHDSLETQISIGTQVLNSLTQNQEWETLAYVIRNDRLPEPIQKLAKAKLEAICIQSIDRYRDKEEPHYLDQMLHDSFIPEYIKVLAAKGLIELYTKTKGYDKIIALKTDISLSRLIREEIK